MESKKPFSYENFWEWYDAQSFEWHSCEAHGCGGYTIEGGLLNGEFKED